MPKTWLSMLALVTACSAAHAADDAGSGVTDVGSDGGSGATDGGSDVGAVPCDAPPIAYCRVAVTAGGPTCCGSLAPPLCRTGGGFACGPGTIELTSCGACSTPASCVSPTECSVVPVSCCGQCGSATSGDLIAVRTDEASAWRTTACGGGPFACPECATMQDPYLVATCTLGNCAARDLHVDPLTECTTDADCTLAPATCCACGEIGLGAAIAYNPAAGSLAQLICDPRADCPPCVPTFTGIEARCDAGRCAVMPL